MDRSAPLYRPATSRTIYFIGVTTGQSSIMKVFPRWAEALGLDAEIRGIDFVAECRPGKLQRGCRVHQRRSPLARRTGDDAQGLPTQGLARSFRRARSLAATLGEISCISKRGGRFAATPRIRSARPWLEAIVEPGYWRRNRADLLILGAGGSAMALTLYLHDKAKEGGDVPMRILVTARLEQDLADIRAVHRRVRFAIPVEYCVTPEPASADRIVGQLPEGSMVVNATGLGKDRPGSPLTDDVAFPRQRHRVGVQLSRRSYFPRPGKGGAKASPFARRGRLGLFHSRLDARHGRSL